MVGLLLLFACAKPGTAHGTIVDGRTHKPVADLELSWTSDQPAPCDRRSTRTDGAGSWSVADICPGTTWRLMLSDPDWWTDAPPVVADEAGVEVNLELWRVPTVDGIYLLQGTQLTALRSHSAIDSALLADRAELLRFPLEIPGTVPRIAGDTVLILAGKEAQTLRWEPLLPAGPLRFGSAESPTEVGPWFYLGSRVTAAGVEPVVTMPDPTAIRQVGPSDRSVQMMSGGLPAGRYGLSAPEGRRLWIFDVGEAAP